MRRFFGLAAVAALSLTLAACASLPTAARKSCYWMTQDGSQWVEMSDVASKKQCFALDSCSGGQGMSGGGCYKWATSPTAPADRW